MSGTPGTSGDGSASDLPEGNLSVDPQPSTLTASSSASNSGRSLRDWLEKPCHLELVLRHLVDDGLHECRRVCRLWRDVCDDLPVKLGEIPKEDIAHIVRKFPKAVAMRMRTGPDCTLRNVDQPLFDSISQLTYLENLGIEAYVGEGQGTGCNFTDLLGPHYLNSHCLRSLRISLDSGDYDCLYICSQIRYLTNLTSLIVLFPDRYFEEIQPYLNIEPFTELKKIEHLDVGFLLVGSGEGLMFPSLTNLTSLSLEDTVQGKALRVIESYASSLQSLIVAESAGPDFITNWSLLKSFTKLADLEIKFLDVSNAPLFWSTARDLTRLTRLSYIGIYEQCQPSFECLCALTGLKSLKINTPFSNAQFSVLFSNLSQLTQLEISEIASAEPFRYLGCLKDLKIYFERGDIDMFELVNRLPDLESLKLRCPDGIQLLPSFCVDLMKNLKSLTLINMELEEDFFSALAELEWLRELYISYPTDSVYPFLHKINDITKLKVLGLFLPGAQNLGTFIEEGRLPHLQNVFLSDAITLSPTIDLDKQLELFQKFPSLRKSLPFEALLFSSGAYHLF